MSANRSFGADFLHHFGLLVDMVNGKLVDTLTFQFME